MNFPDSIKDYLFVGIQILLFVAFIFPLHFTTIQLPEWLRYSGLFFVGLGTITGLIAILQLNTKLSPFPTPVATGKLLTHGVFAFSRHPIYTALIIAGLGYTIFSASIYKLLIVVLLTILFYFKSAYEERLLTQKFPEYQDYKKKTRRFI